MPTTRSLMFPQPSPETLALFRKQGIAVRQVETIAPDASTRCFFRLYLDGGRSVVAVLYPPGSPAVVAHHLQVAHWAQRQGLPTPRLLMWGQRIVLMEDLGKVQLRQALLGAREHAEQALLASLARFQRVRASAPNPPFDEETFLRELKQFLDFARLPSGAYQEALGFSQALSQALTAHPYRLCHRDFHLDNLLLSDGTVKAVDFQDLRAGPDTYDLVSLLRERGGSQTFDEAFLTKASHYLALSEGWQDRFWQCAAQRGLKALGTFLKLATLGRKEYLNLIPEVAENTAAALALLRAPASLTAKVAELKVQKCL